MSYSSGLYSILKSYGTHDYFDLVLGWILCHLTRFFGRLSAKFRWETSIHHDSLSLFRIYTSTLIFYVDVTLSFLQ